MPSTHEHTELDQLRDRIRQLEDTIIAARAALTVGEPDWRARCGDAADALRRLLRLPSDRPGSWEAEHVEALEHELHDVLAAVAGDGGGGGR